MSFPTQEEVLKVVGKKGIWEGSYCCHDIHITHHPEHIGYRLFVRGFKFKVAPASRHWGRFVEKAVAAIQQLPRTASPNNAPLYQKVLVGNESLRYEHLRNLETQHDMLAADAILTLADLKSIAREIGSTPADILKFTRDIVLSGERKRQRIPQDAGYRGEALEGVSVQAGQDESPWQLYRMMAAHIPNFLRSMGTTPPELFMAWMVQAGNKKLVFKDINEVAEEFLKCIQIDSAMSYAAQKRRYFAARRIARALTEKYGKFYSAFLDIKTLKEALDIVFPSDKDPEMYNRAACLDELVFFVRWGAFDQQRYFSPDMTDICQTMFRQLPRFARRSSRKLLSSVKRTVALPSEVVFETLRTVPWYIYLPSFLCCVVGMRSSEVNRLVHENIRLDERKIHIALSKTGPHDIENIDDNIIEVLSLYRGCGGSIIYKSDWWRILREYLFKAILKVVPDEADRKRYFRTVEVSRQTLEFNLPRHTAATKLSAVLSEKEVSHILRNTPQIRKTNYIDSTQKEDAPEFVAASYLRQFSPPFRLDGEMQATRLTRSLQYWMWQYVFEIERIDFRFDNLNRPKVREMAERYIDNILPMMSTAHWPSFLPTPPVPLILSREEALMAFGTIKQRNDIRFKLARKGGYSRPKWTARRREEEKRQKKIKRYEQSIQQTADSKTVQCIDENHHGMDEKTGDPIL